MWIADIRFERGITAWGQLPRNGFPEVAMVGRSNVGKSSLINMIAGRRQLARTSRTPGKTQELNYYAVNQCCYLVDLPGYGYAKVARARRQAWQNLIDRYLIQRAQLRAAVLLVDGRHPPMASDLAIVSLLRTADLPWVIVLTKSDKLSGNERPKSVARTREALEAQGLAVPVILSSSKTHSGRQAILDWMEHFLGYAPDKPQSSSA